MGGSVGVGVGRAGLVGIGGVGAIGSDGLGVAGGRISAFFAVFGEASDSIETAFAYSASVASGLVTMGRSRSRSMLRAALVSAVLRCAADCH